MKKRGHRELVVFGRRAVREALDQDARDLEVCEVWVAKSVPEPFRWLATKRREQSRVNP